MDSSDRTPVKDDLDLAFMVMMTKNAWSQLATDHGHIPEEGYNLSPFYYSGSSLTTDIQG